MARPSLTEMFFPSSAPKFLLSGQQISPSPSPRYSLTLYLHRCLYPLPINGPSDLSPKCLSTLPPHSRRIQLSLIPNFLPHLHLTFDLLVPQNRQSFGYAFSLARASSPPPFYSPMALWFDHPQCLNLHPDHHHPARIPPAAFSDTPQPLRYLTCLFATNGWQGGN